MRIEKIAFHDSGISELLKLGEDQAGLIFAFDSKVEEDARKGTDHLEKIFGEYLNEVSLGTMHAVVPVKKVFRIIQHLKTAGNVRLINSIDLTKIAYREIEANKEKERKLHNQTPNKSKKMVHKMQSKPVPSAL